MRQIVKSSLGIAILLLTALAATTPLLLHGPSCGHDFDFHLISWMEARQAWQQHNFYPHWTQSPDWGAGEPRFVFYPPVTWMLGAAIGSILPWTAVPATLTWILLAALGLGTRALARQWLPQLTATLAGVLSICAGYTLFTAYERTAYGELASGLWITLLLLFALRQKQNARAFDTSTAPLALILAAAWLTNAPAGVMCSYLLAFTAIVGAIATRQWWPILRASVAAPLALALAAFYLVPAAAEQKWIEVKQAIDTGMRIADSWLFARHTQPDLTAHDVVLHTASMLAAVTIAAAVLAGTLLILRRNEDRDCAKNNRRWWLLLMLLPLAAFLLQLPVSALIWHLLPRLEFLQFPWRWLAVITPTTAILFAAAFLPRERRARYGVAAAVLIFALIAIPLAYKQFAQTCDDEDNVLAQLANFTAGDGVAGTDEYAPAGADNTMVASNLPDACLVTDPTAELGEEDKQNGDIPTWYAEQGTCDDTFDADLWLPEHKQFHINSDEDGYLILRQRTYPAWRITVNLQPITQLPGRDDGLMAIPIHAGPNNIDIHWLITPDAALGNKISIIALLPLLGLCLVEWRIHKRYRRTLNAHPSTIR